ncbi:hypothetical protein B0H13DRAFT_2560441 [Mycena leptocephala]|nr:hypothetical protein B0H13DRAFT_2560441 [Mycena leptocephala]
MENIDAALLRHSPAVILELPLNSGTHAGASMDGDSPWTEASPESSSEAVGPIIGDTLFRAFPTELLIEIFVQSCGIYCPIGKVTEGPMLLLQVCQAWKELALQTPQLWASFALDFPSPLPGPDKSDFLVSEMKGWLERSLTVPLSFKFYYPASDATCTNFIQCILASSARWRNVSLCAPSTNLLPLWEARPDSFTCLKVLKVETLRPSLIPSRIFSLGVNWAQITELNLFLITMPTLDECLHILKQSISLTRCSMNAICLLSSNDIGHIHLPELEHLGLTLYEEDTGSLHPDSRLLAFLDTLSIPALQSLKIRWNVTRGPNRPYFWSPSYASKFVDFLGELGSHLKALHLAYLPFTTQEVLQCLRVVPLLKHLDVSLPQGEREHDFINDEFLGALTEQPGYSGLLPALQSIRLESHGESFSNPVLLRFIASRWRYQESATSELECVVIVSPKRHTEYRSQEFKDVKEGRLEVVARLKSKFKMVDVLSSFLNRDSYGKKICFLNGDFPPHIRLMLIFG